MKISQFECRFLIFSNVFNLSHSIHLLEELLILYLIMDALNMTYKLLRIKVLKANLSYCYVKIYGRWNISELVGLHGEVQGLAIPNPWILFNFCNQ